MPNLFRFAKTIKQFHEEGIADENLVMRIVESTCGGKTWKSNSLEDIYDHIDFWWDSPKMGKIGVDVKGIKRNSRVDKDKDDNINWIEVTGVTGHPGWIYGKSKYIAFRTNNDIIFVKTDVLRKYAEECIKGKEVVYRLPDECYVPYQRKGRKDLVFKVYKNDLIELTKSGGFILSDPSPTACFRNRLEK